MRSDFAFAVERVPATIWIRNRLKESEGFSFAKKKKTVLKTDRARRVEQDLHHSSVSRQDLITGEVARL